MESDQTLFRAKFPYQPENADEIALQKGTLTFDSKLLRLLQYRQFIGLFLRLRKRKIAEPENLKLKL